MTYQLKGEDAVGDAVQDLFDRINEADEIVAYGIVALTVDRRVKTAWGAENDKQACILASETAGMLQLMTGWAGERIVEAAPGVH